MANSPAQISRREFLKVSSSTAAALTLGVASKSLFAGPARRQRGHKVIVIGIDGMDPRLCEQMMGRGLLPTLDRLHRQGGYRVLGTSIPPQSPVAWANFITGAGPGAHGLFDFIHRDPQRPSEPFFSAARTLAGDGFWTVGDHRIQATFWPFCHTPPATVLCRQGTPFWDYLDRAGIGSQFYDLPADYPPSPSRHGHHRCLAGMGTPDLLGTYGTYQYFSEDGPVRPRDEPGGRRSMVIFEDETSQPHLTLIGPPNGFLKKPAPTSIDFLVHRDRQAQAVVIEIQDHKFILREKEWSPWLKLKFRLTLPAFTPDKLLSGICRFYVQEVAPNFRLYVTPINADPSDPAISIATPPDLSQAISRRLGLFYTTGFQEDHKALANKVFSDEEFAVQASKVLDERLALLDYALQHYDDGLLFFYFSSTDLQSHMFWWDSDAPHPTRSAAEARRCFQNVEDLYRQLDRVVGDILARYGSEATVLVMSDHGFANFRRQFSLNSWLRDHGYLYPAEASSVLTDIDWTRTKAYGLGINGLYLNLKGRERDGIVEPGRQQEELIRELVAELGAVRDADGRSVIRNVHRADRVYSGPATALAPDLIIGYAREFRASWATCLGGLTKEVLLDNDSAWAADHCADVSEVPGVLFCNRPITARSPSLIDLAPSILAHFGQTIPSAMTGRNIFT